MRREKAYRGGRSSAKLFFEYSLRHRLFLPSFNTQFFEVAGSALLRGNIHISRVFISALLAGPAVHPERCFSKDMINAENVTARTSHIIATLPPDRCARPNARLL